MGVAVSCKETPVLEGFDQKTWKSDRLGCNGQRAKSLPLLKQQKEKLKRLGQNQVLQLLGKPDFQELASRNQRFYIYYHRQGQQCQGVKGRLQADAILRIRFDALDRVNEITL